MRPIHLRATAGAAALLLAACTGDRLTAPAEPAPAPRFTLGGTSLVLNEILPNPAAVADADGEWFEVHNPGASAVSLQGWTIASGNDSPHTISAAVSVPAGGYVVLARSGNAATNGGVTAAYAYGGGINLNNSNTDWLALRDGAGVTVDSVAWGSGSPPNGSSRGVKDVTADNATMSGTNWQTQTTVFGAGDRGTPGAANDGVVVPPPPPGTIVVSEVLFDPSAVADADGEWLEVHNRGGAAVNLQGWVIRSNNDTPHTISASVPLPAGGYVVLARNGAAASNGGVTAAYAYGGGSSVINLANSSDWIVLRDAGGTTVDSVAWSSGHTSGTSRSVVDASLDNVNVSGSNWANSTTSFGAGDRGTPGAANVTSGGSTGGGSTGGGGTGAVATVTVAMNTPRQIPVGYTKPAFPTARDSANVIVSPPPAYVWTSSDTTVARVDSLGYVHGMGTGMATIRATAPGGAFGETTVTVIAATASTTAVYRSHVAFGTPADGNASDDVLLSKPQFSVSYNPTRGGPNWVSWNLNATHFGAAPRCDCFTADATLPSGVYRVVDFDFRGGGYDRGHLVQSESRTTTDQENAATFLLTNILPQAADNNQGPWLAFENHLNDLVRNQGKEVYVIAGGEYAATPPTLKGEGKVQVPDHTWKIAVVLDAGEGLADVLSAADVQVIAIRIPNRTDLAQGTPGSSVGIRNTAWTAFVTTVDALEAATGYDFLAALPDAIEAAVEQ